MVSCLTARLVRDVAYVGTERYQGLLHRDGRDLCAMPRLFLASDLYRIRGQSEGQSVCRRQRIHSSCHPRQLRLGSWATLLPALPEMGIARFDRPSLHDLLTSINVIRERVEHCLLYPSSKWIHGEAVQSRSEDARRIHPRIRRWALRRH